jgi:RNA polymerase sigma-70 factor, ECF subfamily
MKQRKKTYRELASEFKRTKSEKSFTELYHKMYPGMIRYVTKIVKDGDLAQDLVSEIFAKVHAKIHTYDPAWEITTWAYRIAYNQCMGHFRKKKKQPITLSLLGGNTEDEDSSLMEILLLREDESMSTDEHIEEDELIKQQFNFTKDAITALPPMYKPYMVECFFNGKTYKEIAAMMQKHERGVTVQTVKNRIFRGRKILKGQIKSFEAAL